MNDALGTVSCEEWQVAKRARDATLARVRAGQPSKGDETPPTAKALQDATKQGVGYALVKNSKGLIEEQKGKLTEMRRAESRLLRTWDLKEDLRAVFQACSAQKDKGLLTQ